MIIHGEGDRRAPFSQAKALRSALEDRKVPVEWLVRPGEGHGFWKVENIEAEYRGVLAFLDKNIGPASVPPAAQAASAAATPVANVQQ
jgi:dipeptidyl aminopeptidase/acylaminoacyl peptidase